MNDSQNNQTDHGQEIKVKSETDLECIFKHENTVAEIKIEKNDFDNNESNAENTCYAEPIEADHDDEDNNVIFDSTDSEDGNGYKLDNNGVW